TLLFGVLSFEAFAADLPKPVYKAPPYKAPILAPAPDYSWTGFYAGGHVGYGWSYLSGTDPTGGSSADLRGWLGGLQLGYNYQMGRFVIGIEGDYSWAGVEYVEDNPFGTGGQAKIENDFF